MADSILPEGLSEQLKKHKFELGELKGSLDEIISTYSKFKDSGMTAADAFSRTADSVDVLKKKFAELMNLQTTEGLQSYLDKLSAGAEDAGKLLDQVGDSLKKFATTKLVATLNVDSSDAQKHIDSLGSMFSGIFNAKNAVGLGAVTLAEGVSSVALDLIKPLSDAEGKLLAFDRSVLSSSANLINAYGNVGDKVGEVTQKTHAVRDAVRDSFSLQTTKLMADFSQSPEEAANAFKTLQDAIPDQDMFAKLNIKSATEQVSGLSAVFAIATATGLGFEGTTAAIEDMTRSLDIDPNKIQTSFEVIMRAAANSGLSIKEMTSNVRTSAEGFKYYGDNVNASAAELRKFAVALGPGRANLAQELFGKMSQHIAGMSSGMKAFIGMTSDLGKGGGALESMLNVEEAMASGEGLDDIRQAITSKIEDLTGAGIMTRREALDTGQSQQYVMQRELIKQFLGVSGDAQADVMAEILQKQGGTEDLQAALTAAAQDTSQSAMLTDALERSGINKGAFEGLRIAMVDLAEVFTKSAAGKQYIDSSLATSIAGQRNLALGLAEDGQRSGGMLGGLQTAATDVDNSKVIERLMGMARLQPRTANAKDNLTEVRAQQAIGAPAPAASLTVSAAAETTRAPAAVVGLTEAEIARKTNVAPSATLLTDVNTQLTSAVVSLSDTNAMFKGISEVMLRQQTVLQDMAAASVQAAATPQKVEVDVKVSLDDNGKLHAVVNKSIQRAAGEARAQNAAAITGRSQ